MSELPFNRRVFWDQDEIPEGTKVLGIRVKDPILTLFTGVQFEQQLPIFDETFAFVELTHDEWNAVKNDPLATDVLARQFGALVQQSLGASWHRWHSNNED